MRRSCREGRTFLTELQHPRLVLASYRPFLTLLFYIVLSLLMTMSLSPRFLRPLSRNLNSSEQWTCSQCLRASRNPLAHREARISTPSRRYLNNSSSPRVNIAPTMEQLRAPYKKKNATLLYYSLSIILGTVALSYGSVPLYKMICQQTGWGGTPVKAHSSSTSSDPSSRLTPVPLERRLRITFHGSTSDVLPWKFVPQQREVRVLPGETALAFYTATNLSDEDIIGVATYSVTPGQVAPYFSKIQCFCFEEQRLNKGETVDMPVFFYIDPDFVNDINMRGIETISLNYTFFKAKYDKQGHLKPVPLR